MTASTYNIRAECGMSRMFTGDIGIYRPGGRRTVACGAVRYRPPMAGVARIPALRNPVQIRPMTIDVRACRDAIRQNVDPMIVLNIGVPAELVDFCLILHVAATASHM